jgi:CMP-N-acetylneuraminic acid synthetase
MKEISAIINARLQSSRVPGKLVRPFADSTLIQIALSKLDRLHYFKHRFIACAEEQLIQLASDYINIEVLHRDMRAVRKGVNPLDVTFRHYLDVPTEWIFVINPCQPLLSPESLEKAFDLFQKTEYISYISAVPVRDWIFDRDGNPVTHKDVKVLATNKTTVHYKVSHSFYIVNREHFRNTGLLWSFTRNDPFIITISEEEILDVDTELEFLVTEEFYKRHCNQNMRRS